MQDDDDAPEVEPPVVTTDEPPAPEHEEAPEVVVEGNAPGETWSPPKFEEGTGIAVDGHGLPLNHRLRAERLADAGKDEDPAGEISAEHIADAKARLAAAKEAKPPVNSSMKVADLERIANDENVDLSDAKNNDERVALIRAARGEENA